jgi:hypothetical protein
MTPEMKLVCTSYNWSKFKSKVKSKDDINLVQDDVSRVTHVTTIRVNVAHGRTIDDVAD